MPRRNRRKDTNKLPHGSFLLVDDPYEAPRPDKDGLLEQPKRVVAANLRDDRLGYMFSRKQVTQAQYAAGRKWQLVYEQSTLGRVRGIDPTREKVDECGVRDPLNSSLQSAMHEFDRARKLLAEDHALCFAILGEGKTLRQVIGEDANWYQVKVLMQSFRVVLDKLAGLWGFAPPPEPTKFKRTKMRAWRQEEKNGD